MFKLNVGNYVSLNNNIILIIQLPFYSYEWSFVQYF